MEDWKLWSEERESEGWTAKEGDDGGRYRKERSGRKTGEKKLEVKERLGLIVSPRD